MNNLILSFFLCLNSFNLTGQNIEVLGGPNNNSFYDYKNTDGPHFISRYSSEYGYSIGISFEHSIDSLSLKYTLKIDNFKGLIYLSDGSAAGQSITYADVNKLSLGLDIYPLNLVLFKNTLANIGISINYLLNEKMVGYQSWSFPGGSGRNLFSNNNSDINNNFIFGAIARLAYEIKISKGWFFIPQYLFYYGLSNEFYNIEADVKSSRHYLEFGLMKKLTKGSRLH